MTKSAGLPGNDPAAFAIDGAQRIVMWSPAAEQLLQIEAAHVMGAPCYQVFAAKDPFGRPVCRPDCAVCQGIETGRVAQQHHLVVQNQQGEKLRLVCDVVPLPPGLGSKAIILLTESATLNTYSSPGAKPGQLAQEWLGSTLRYLSALGAISATPASADLNQALDRSLVDIMRTTGAEVAEIFLRAGPGREMVLTAHQGLFRNTFLQINRFGLGVGFPGLVAATEQPLVTSSLAQDNRYLRSQVKEKGFQFYMCVPLMTDQGVVGCVNIASRHQLTDVPSRLQFLSWAAPSLAASIQMSWLRGQDLLSSYQVEPFLDADWNLDQLLAHVLEVTMTTAQTETGAIALYESSSNTLKTRAARGVHEQGLCDALTLGGAAMCPLLRQNGAVLCDGPRAEWAPACRDLSRDVTAAICLPLRVNGELVAVISLGQNKPDKLWATKYLGILHEISVRAALAVKNARYYLRPREPLAAGDEMLPLTLEPQTARPATGQSGGETQDSSHAPRLDIHCFGRFQIHLDGRLLSPRVFRRRKSLAAIKIFIINRGRPLMKEQLMEYLWPEASPEAAARSLVVVIHDLRRGLALTPGQDSPFIVTEGGSYHFNTEASYRLDVDEFISSVKRGEELQVKGDLSEALALYRSAAQLYRGDFMADEPYHDWCTAERERLREIYVNLMPKIASLLADAGDLESSVRALQQALQVDNLREALHRQLMQYLWWAGAPEEALRHYAVAKKVLAEELGVRPHHLTEELYHTILKERGGTAPSKK